MLPCCTRLYGKNMLHKMNKVLLFKNNFQYIPIDLYLRRNVTNLFFYSTTANNMCLGTDNDHVLSTRE